MKLFLKSLSIFIVLALLLYCGIRYFFLYSIVNYANDYAGKNISIEQITKQPYFLQFSKASQGGFPFKLEIKIEKFEEEGVNSKTSYQNPLYFGYDLLNQRFYLSYSGDILSYYKPLQSGFGSKIQIENSNTYVNLPISFKLFRLLFSKTKDKFELVNFLQNFKFESSKIIVSDLVGNELLYSQEYSKISVDLINHREYKNLEEFVHDIPQKLNILYQSKIKVAPGIIQKTAPDNLLYKFFMIFPGEYKQEIYLSTQSRDLKDIQNNFEIKLISFFTSEKIQNFKNNLIFKNTMDHNTSSGIAFKMNLEFDLKEGIIDDIFSNLKYIGQIYIKNPLLLKLQDEIDYLVANRNSLNLEKLQNKHYNLNLDIGLNQSSDQGSIHVNDVEIFVKGEDADNNTQVPGIKIQGIWEIDNIKYLSNIPKARLKGDIVFYNYNSIADFIAQKIFTLNKYTGYLEHESSFRKSVLIEFLKSVSDHPNSASPDVSFIYDINLEDIASSKLGSITFDKFNRLYNITLYRKIVDEIGLQGNFDDKINKIAPNLSNQEKDFLKQLTINPKQIDTKIWNYLIEN